MSDAPDSDFELDLDLNFLPDWARQAQDPKKFEKFEGRDHTESRRGGPRRGDGPRRGGEGRPSGGPRRGPDRDRGGRGPDRRGGSGDRGERSQGRRGDDRFSGGARGRAPRKEPQPLPEVSINIVPEENGVDSLAKQIRLTGRSYPLFDIANLVLKQPKRFVFKYTVIPGEQGEPKVPLFSCSLDDSLWFSEAEAVGHVLDQHFATFYETEKIPTDPPKGTYTFVAQCGMSGEILGPPNYHDYQTQLRELHARKFSRMPFDLFKSRVKIVKDEETIQKWLESKSFQTQYKCLNVPETQVLNSMAEVEAHFREHHASIILQRQNEVVIPGDRALELVNVKARQLARRCWDEQRRFPLKVVNVLSQQFSRRGLQFFKVDKTITHVAVARPHFLDTELTPVSEGIRKLIELIDSTEGCTRQKLLQLLSPVVENQEADSNVEGGASPATVATEPTPEMAEAIKDLHWLIHQGHVIEFSNGKLETAKKPKSKAAQDAHAAVAPEKLKAAETKADGKTPEPTLEEQAVVLAPANNSLEEELPVTIPVQGDDEAPKPEKIEVSDASAENQDTDSTSPDVPAGEDQSNS